MAVSSVNRHPTTTRRQQQNHDEIRAVLRHHSSLRNTNRRSSRRRQRLGLFLFSVWLAVTWFMILLWFHWTDTDGTDTDTITNNNNNNNINKSTRRAKRTIRRRRLPALYKNDDSSAAVVLDDDNGGASSWWWWEQLLSSLSLLPRQQQEEQINTAAQETTTSRLNNYAANRIPGYIIIEHHNHRTTRTLFGYVMRDLMIRICSRQIGQSHVLVVADDAVHVVHRIKQQQDSDGRTKNSLAEQEVSMRRQFHHTVGGCILLHAAIQGHNITGLDPTMTISQQQQQLPPEEEDDSSYWRTTGGGGGVGHHNSLVQSSSSWLLLTVFDAGRRNDEMVQNVAATLLQKGTTMTYIVIGFGVDKKNNSDNNIDIFGMDAAIYLYEKHKYKIGLLSMSQYMPNYRPNTDITGKERIEVFTTRLVNLLQTKTTTGGNSIRGYLFATQGLDLPIPTATEYILRAKKPDQIKYIQCPASSDKDRSVVRVNFVTNNNNTNSDNETSSIHVSSGCRKESGRTVWSSHAQLERSEAVCVRVECTDTKNTGNHPEQQQPASSFSSSCTTRIMPKPAKKQVLMEDALKEKKKSRQDDGDNRPNLLLFMIDPISRARFERSLPKTNRLLQRLNFTSFSKYTAVGNNSGPNQCALYSGFPLKSRDSIATHRESSGAGFEWLWDRLNQAGYATFKAEDGCVENSNMIQSVRPNVDHGDAFNRMMCFDFARPNCVGGASAAEHLTTYSAQFMNQYKRRKWAAFLHFVDSHEDSMALEGTLDDVLFRHLFSVYQPRSDAAKLGTHEMIPTDVWNNTMVVLISDHGLHYGSYLLSPQGLRERSQPIFHVHLPSSMSKTQARALESNKGLWTTSFDVHETILDALLGSQSSGIGSTMLKPLSKERTSCGTTTSIPSGVCDILQPLTTQATIMPPPPSVLSFYADMPRANKISLARCQHATSSRLFEKDQNCVCSTSHRTWYNCTEKPWSAPTNENHSISDTFQIVDCGEDQSYEIRVKPDPLVLERREVQEAESTGANLLRPNILFIEIDSVSFAYADRHFVKTRELLERRRLRQGENNNSYVCNGLLCAAEMKALSVVGANSIPNFVAAFSGCIVTTGPERCLPATAQIGAICNDPSKSVHRMNLLKRYRNSQTWCWTDAERQSPSPSPWIFDIAKKAGYATLFAEEFCYDDSEYVAQGNIFDLDADILPHRVFCRVAERKAMLQGVSLGNLSVPIWKFENADPIEPCVAGTGSFPRSSISLEHVEQMWDAYRDTPKLAFVNAMAAHVYKGFASMAVAAEAYDDVLSSFLERMFERDDADNTIFIIRSDHGLQGGPKIADYNIQIEALRPWTEIVVPKTLPSVTLPKLFQNQHRLVSGFDLYRVLAESISFGGKELTPIPSPWAINFFRYTISENRSCVDAKVPVDYCIYEDQRTFTAPNVGTCNLAEADQKFLCPAFAKHFQDLRAAEVEQAFVASTADDKHVQNKTLGHSHVQQWQNIDKLVRSFPGSRVSGGIFLYPHQTSLLRSIVGILGGSIHSEGNRFLNVCETGFGAGHSAALFLEASPFARVHTFDKFDRPYQLPIVQQLKSNYKGRLLHYVGNSCKTVPKVLTVNDKGRNPVQCDILHGSSLCPTDNIDLVSNSPCGAILTSTAMDSLSDDAVYFGRRGQWTQLAERGCIRDITCYGEEERTLEREFVFKRDGGRIAHKFCVAVTTGRCSNEREDGGTCESTISRISSRIDFSQFIDPSFQVLPPKEVQVV